MQARLQFINHLLYQKILMKINFEQLFGTDKKALKKASHVSQASTSLGFEEPAPSPSQQKDMPQKAFQDWILKAEKKTTNQTMRILHNSKSNQPAYCYYVQTRLDEEPISKQQTSRKVGTATKIKQLSKEQATKLADRLTKPQKCTKEFCHKICRHEIDRRMKEENLPLDAPLKNHKKSLTEICEFEARNPSKLHEGLYAEYKARQFRHIQLANQYEEMRQDSTRRYQHQNKGYEEKYVPFYDRLGEELQKRAKRQQFYEQNVVENGHIVVFSPDITASQQSLCFKERQLTVKPRKQKRQIKGYGQMRYLEKLSSSLNKSFESVLNRSTEIVQVKQEKMIAQMTQLFEGGGYFRVRPEAIESLEEKQFQIFWPLIVKLQKESQITIGQFETRLRNFLQQMPKQNKLALRKMAIQKQKGSKIKIEEFQQSKAHSKKRGPSRDYLDKIKNFI